MIFFPKVLGSNTLKPVNPSIPKEGLEVGERHSTSSGFAATSAEGQSKSVTIYFHQLNGIATALGNNLFLIPRESSPYTLLLKLTLPVLDRPFSSTQYTCTEKTNI